MLKLFLWCPVESYCKYRLENGQEIMESGLSTETDHPMIPQNYPPWKTKMEAENKTALLKGTSSEPNLHFWVLAVKFWECTWKIPSNSKLPTLTTNQTLIELFCMKKELRL